MSRMEDAVKSFINNFKIVQEEYTEMQLVSLMTQMIQSGDLQLHSYKDKWNDLAELTYKPYREKQHLLKRIEKLEKVNELLTTQRDKYAGKPSPYEVISYASFEYKQTIIDSLNKEIKELIDKMELSQGLADD